MPAHFVAWTKVAARHGLTFPEDRFYALGGVPTAKIAAMLIAEAGPRRSTPVAIALEKEQAYFDGLAARRDIRAIEPVAGARAPPPRRDGAAGRRLGQRAAPRDAHAGGAGDRRLVRRRRRRRGHRPATSPSPTSSSRRRAAWAPPRPTCTVYEDTDIGLEAARRAGMQPRRRPPADRRAPQPRYEARCLMPKNAAILRARAEFFCAAGRGPTASAGASPSATCRWARMSLMMPASSGFSCEDLLEGLLVDDVALDVGLGDHGGRARLAGHERHLAEELPRR